MTIADIYDALTARDRPYKKALPTERALDILGFEVKDGHLDAELVRIFREAEDLPSCRPDSSTTESRPIRIRIGLGLGLEIGLGLGFGSDSGSDSDRLGLDRIGIGFGLWFSIAWTPVDRGGLLMRDPLCDGVFDLVGNTPLVRLARIPETGGAEVRAKLERKNPAGSVKDRPALAMMLAAERAGRSARAPRSSRPPAATPASAWPCCARRAAIAACW